MELSDNCRFFPAQYSSIQVFKYSTFVPKVTFHYAGQVKTVEAQDGQTILQIALDNGIPMEHACGGNGFCTTCMCRVKEGMTHLSPRNEREENMGIVDDPERLGCQTEVQGDVEVELSDW
ncbi:(2Fe-2S)-binding protein [Candidatus Peregrinibacteria bacterium]|nr:(2Fe-2S)-binding protein [Candidatus Peregrinibacteria bacterium]